QGRGSRREEALEETPSGGQRDLQEQGAGRVLTAGPKCRTRPTCLCRPGLALETRQHARRRGDKLVAKSRQPNKFVGPARHSPRNPLCFATSSHGTSSPYMTTNEEPTRMSLISLKTYPIVVLDVRECSLRCRP